jgi:hypothetical protein
MDYTVIGDSVNLASRIESMTKAYGTDLLISGSVHERVQSRFVCEAAKSARVKGKSNVVEVYHVRGTMDANGIPTIIETPWSTYKASSDEKVMMETESPSKVLRKPPPFRGDQTGAGFGFNTAPRMVVPPPFRGERTQTLNLPVPSASDPQEAAAPVETAAQLIGIDMPVLEEKSKSGTSSKPVIRRKAA